MGGSRSGELRAGHHASAIHHTGAASLVVVLSPPSGQQTESLLGRGIHPWRCTLHFRQLLGGSLVGNDFGQLGLACSESANRMLQTLEQRVGARSIHVRPVAFEAAGCLVVPLQVHLRLHG